MGSLHDETRSAHRQPVGAEPASRHAELVALGVLHDHEVEGVLGVVLAGPALHACAERDELLDKVVAAAPRLAEHQSKTSRVIPLFELLRV